MYENIFNKYDATLAGVKIISIDSVTIGTDAPTPVGTDGKYGTVTISLNVNVTAQLTGRYVSFSDGSVGYQIIYNGTQYGYIFSTDLNQWKKVTDGSQVNAQNTLNEIIGYNKSILEGNLLCARMIGYCKDNGIVLPTSARSDLYNLQSRLVSRNNQIINSGYVDVSSVEKSSSPNFSLYNNSLTDFMNNPGIGVFVVDDLVVIIVIAIVIGASATAAISIYKSMHKEAVTDFGLSNDLTAQLVKFLPAETYKQLMSENEANAKKAQDAIDNASGGGIMNTLKWVAVGLGGFWIVDRFILNK